MFLTSSPSVWLKPLTALYLRLGLHSETPLTDLAVSSQSSAISLLPSPPSRILDSESCQPTSTPLFGTSPLKVIWFRLDCQQPGCVMLKTQSIALHFLLPLVFNNSLSFHEHRGEKNVTPFVFINIVERRKSDIFSAFVFNNLKQFTPIFRPLFFPHDPGYRGQANYFIFNNIDFYVVFALHWLTPFFSDTLWRAAPLFSVPAPELQVNSLYLNKIKCVDMLTLNTNPFCFW